MKHTSLIRLQAAETRYQIAVESCPHWDYEGDGAGHPCCDELEDAKHERKAAQRAYSRETGE